MAAGRMEEAIRAPGGAEARATGALLAAGAGMVALSLALPHPPQIEAPTVIAIGAAMLVAGATCWFAFRSIPILAVHALLASVALCAGLLTVASGIAAGQFNSLFVWGTLVASYFFSRPIAAAHVAWVLTINTGGLLLVDSTAGYSPLTRAIFTGVLLVIVMLLTTEIVARRARADQRARHFFDLSRDMLCTANLDGYFVELNSAWQRVLGYTPQELRATPFVEMVHPEDRERTFAETAALFDGAGSAGFENRYRAKDGTWRWLRWSSELSPAENLIYARAADITELKRIEAEREELLDEVSSMARHDALTGIPNRRVLDERLPQEMARARRSLTPLCLAILDIDHFKAYNDAHGHPAGDAVLRECAAAWDAELRGEDTLVRFGGEEFLVVLPNCTPLQAVEIVERLRAATPNGQTCSAGLACWDFIEPGDDLIGRADNALYAAKEGGRDRLVEAPELES